MSSFSEQKTVNMQNHKSKFITRSDRSRLIVYRSNRFITASLIDSESKRTICSLSSKKIEAKGKPTEVAFATGQALAKQILSKKIDRIAFDRQGYRYHGRVKAFADGLREGGLKF